MIPYIKGTRRIVKQIENNQGSNTTREYFLEMSAEEPIIKTPEERIPTGGDYAAAAMITNGIAWGWMQILGSGTILSDIPIRFLSDITFVIYLIAGAVGAYLTGKRADSKHLKVGLISSLYSLGFSLLIMLTSAPEPTLGLFLALGVCFGAGSIFGSYRVIQMRTAAKRKERRAQLEQEEA